MPYGLPTSARSNGHLAPISDKNSKHFETRSNSKTARDAKTYFRKHIFCKNFKWISKLKYSRADLYPRLEEYLLPVAETSAGKQVLRHGRGECDGYFGDVMMEPSDGRSEFDGYLRDFMIGPSHGHGEFDDAILKMFRSTHHIMARSEYLHRRMFIWWLRLCCTFFLCELHIIF